MTDTAAITTRLKELTGAHKISVVRFPDGQMAAAARWQDWAVLFNENEPLEDVAARLKAARAKVTND